MGYFGAHFYSICEMKWENKFQEFVLENWSRLLDDCQTPLDKNKVKRQELLETLNCVNKAIHVTMKFSDK